MTRPTVADLAGDVAALAAAVQWLEERAAEPTELLPTLVSDARTVVVAPWSGVVKALIGAAVAGLGVLGTALTDGGLTGAEAVGAAVAALTALTAVYSLPNRAPVGVI